MPQAARISDSTSHGGLVLGPGHPTVLIAGMPASTVGDLHACKLPDSSSHPKQSQFTSGSGSVFIEGKPALRVGDRAVCGAAIIAGASTVLIG